MPEYPDLIEANQFWDAPETDIFPLPIVALALGIGRNKMHRIPVNRIMIRRRACYRKSDIIDWALSEQTKGKDNLLLQLRAEISSIAKLIEVKSDFYDYYYSRSLESHYRGTKETKEAKHIRLCKEWGAYRRYYTNSIKHKLACCNDDVELESLVSIAWELREQFVKMRMGLPRGMELENWWFAGNLEEVKSARDSRA